MNGNDTCREILEIYGFGVGSVLVCLFLSLINYVVL